MKFNAVVFSCLALLGACQVVASEVDAPISDPALDMLVQMNHADLMHLVAVLSEIKNAHFEDVLEAMIVSPLGGPDVVLSELVAIRQDEVDVLQSQIADTQSSIDALQNDVNNLQNNVGNAQMELSELEGQLDMLFSVS